MRVSGLLVLADLANNPITGNDFRTCLLEKGGTLYLSWAHLVELYGLGNGPTYKSVRTYLASFGRSFVIIDNHAQAVIDREAARTPETQNPAIDEEFLRVLLKSWNGLSELNVGLLLDVGDDPAFFTKLQTLHRRHKDSLKKSFDEARDQYRRDPGAKRKLDNEIYPCVEGTSATDYFYKQIARECVTTHERFNPSDSLDFEHCVVSLAYCDFVVFDKKWARRCEMITMPLTAAKVFSTIQVDRLMSQIKSWPNA